ncbi:MAG: enoyl-CoA hydratase/isomerase family protein [Rhodobacteraceae bacterium]|nr:enoyl-CoA hydratase/isomerase family protein [Paracoccaceae bacterium]
MNHPSPSPIETRRDNGWLTIWLNRPESRNALSDDMSAALMQCFADLRADRTMRGVTIRGKGGTFCAGGDLKGFKAMAAGGQTVADVATMSRRAGDLFQAVHTLPQVVVVLIEGAAMAGGLGLACAADVVAGTRDAKFALTETMIGIPPAQIAPHVVRRVGPIAARRIMLTGARFEGEAAHGYGILDHLCDDAAGLDAFEEGIRRGVMRCAPGANAVTKEILSAAEHMAPEALMDFAARGFAECLVGEEGREGVASFLEKRKPVWAQNA